VEEQLEAPKKEEQVSTEKATANITPSIADHQPSNPSLTMADGRIKASPLAKSTAKDLNVNLSGVVGTGPNGRIVNADVMSAKPAVATPGSSFVDIPLSNMRRVIAQRLTDSKQTIPHYYLTVDISMDQLTELRERLNKHNAGRFKISVNDFIIKAAARAMSDVPEVNSAWYGTFIRQYQHADISVAVATEAGLITPIIKQANLKGLEGIANEMKELVGKARENKLKPEEFQGGSFTISNLGMFGVKHFTAIINPPQTCILAVGGTDRRIIPDENGVPTIVPMMTVTMSCDHRAVDGATGARWLQHFKRYMEDPITILL
jgi:pyruvate dehydrogenase E2 component (dihydrolipoamide acetyltransferase)